ncbi:MAG: hypothetical protein J0H54_14100 [Rhizobiales bacterium]|nr:hypothetical protein [Hyphomicrobiales bacterium]
MTRTTIAPVTNADLCPATRTAELRRGSVEQKPQPRLEERRVAAAAIMRQRDGSTGMGLGGNVQLLLRRRVNTL